MKAKQEIARLVEAEPRYLGAVTVDVYEKKRTLLSDTWDVLMHVILRLIGPDADTLNLYEAYYLASNDVRVPADTSAGFLRRLGRTWAVSGFVQQFAEIQRPGDYTLAVHDGLAAIAVVGPKPVLERLSRKLAATAQ